MLTKSERKWLNDRVNRPAPCGMNLDECRGCTVLFCPIRSDWQDAAEFEAISVAELAKRYEMAEFIEHKFHDVTVDDYIKVAHISAEMEIERRERWAKRSQDNAHD